MTTITNLSAYSKTDSFLYSLLSRLQEDCKYYLGNGSRNSKYLWALNESEHINEMKGIYNYLEIKPDWLTMQEIENFEQQFNIMKTEVHTNFGYKYIIDKGAELLSNEVKEYLFNFNPILFHNDIDCYYWFFDQKINNTGVWIESKNIDLINNKIEINLYK